MRIIDVCGAAIRATAVSPDGRFVAASAANGWFGVYHWATGESVRSYPAGFACEQFAFAPDDRWVASVRNGALWFEPLEGATMPPQSPGPFAGGLAVSPDGREFVAATAGGANQARLARWSLPAMRPELGVDFWSPFRRLAFSPNGHFIGAIWPGQSGRWRAEPPQFELRFAQSGGLDFRYPPVAGGVSRAAGFVSFARDGTTCAFGWEAEFHVIDISTGTSRYLRRVEASFTDGAFAGSGRLFTTVGADGRVRMWDAGAWRVAREYDWGCGPLTCLAFTGDGAAGVCGTAAGQLVQFDVDE